MLYRSVGSYIKICAKISFQIFFSLFFLSVIEDILITISSDNKKVDRIATQFDSIRNLINLHGVWTAGSTATDNLPVNWSSIKISRTSCLGWWVGTELFNNCLYPKIWIRARNDRPNSDFVFNNLLCVIRPKLAETRAANVYAIFVVETTCWRINWIITSRTIFLRQYAIQIILPPIFSCRVQINLSGIKSSEWVRTSEFVFARAMSFK